MSPSTASTSQGNVPYVEVEEIDARRRPTTRVDLDAVREPSGRHDLAAKPTDEVHRRGNAVLAAADGLKAKIAALASTPCAPWRDDAHDLRVGRESRLEACRCGEHLRVRGATAASRVDHDLGRRDRTLPGGVSEDVERARGLEVLGIPWFVPGPTSSQNAGIANASSSAIDRST